MLKIFDPNDLSAVKIYENFKNLPSHSFGIGQRLKDGKIKCGDIEPIFAYAKAFKNKSLSSSNGDFMILDNLNELTLDNIDITKRDSFVENFLLPWAIDLDNYMKKYAELIETKTPEQVKEDFRDLTVELRMIKDVYKNVSLNIADTMKQKHYEFFEMDILNKLDCENIDDRDVIMEIFKHIFQNFELLNEHGQNTLNLNEVKDFSLSLNLMQAIKFSTKNLSPKEMENFKMVKDDVISWVNIIENVIHGMSHLRDIIETPFKQQSTPIAQLDKKVSQSSDLVPIIDAVFLSMRDQDTFRGSVRTFCSERMSDLMLKALDMIEPIPLCNIDKVYLITRYLVSPFLRKHMKKSEIDNPLILACLNILLTFTEHNEMKDDLTSALMMAFSPIIPAMVMAVQSNFMGKPKKPII